MKIKHCTDVDGSIIQQHLFVFVDLLFLSENVTKKLGETMERSCSPLPFSLPPQRLNLLFIYAELWEMSGVISFLTARPLSSLCFNHLEAERDTTSGPE